MRYRAFGLLPAAAWIAGLAQAQVCEEQRPTDPAGSQGVSYGSAAVEAFDSPSGLARIHYALTGTHAPPAKSTLETGVPDAVAVAAQAADDALAKFAELGFVAPLSDADSPCDSNGDSDAVDVYLVNFTAADGQALLDHCEPGKPKRCAGFVLVDNDFRVGGYADTAEGLRTVVPHELFHLVQNAYDTDVERWWAEGSAQWAAKQVYPELQDLERFLPNYFATPWRPINIPPPGIITSFLYATAIWPVFLHEHYDISVVREVFEGFAQPDSKVLPTTDAVLASHDSSLAEAILQFAAYNAATGSRTPDEGGYTNAANYPEAPLTDWPAAAGATIGDNASGVGAFYYHVNAEAPLDLTLQGPPNRVAASWLPLVDGKAVLSELQPLPLTISGEGIVVAAGQSTARTDAFFTLQLAEPATTEPLPPEDEEESDKNSGCTLAARPRGSERHGSSSLTIVISLLGAAWARSRRRKDL